MNCGVIVDNEYNNDIRVLREVTMLRESDFNVTVLCFGFKKDYNNPADGVKIIRINIPAKLKDIIFFAFNSLPVYEWLWTYHTRKFIKRNNPDIIHTHDLYMSRAIYRGIERSGEKIPLILDLHENYPYTVETYNWTKGFFRSRISQPAKWKEKEKEYLSYATRIIVLSNYFRDSLLKKYKFLGREKFEVIPNVPDLTSRKDEKQKRPGPFFENSYPVMFYYGVVAERRGIFDALSVFTGLVKENQKINFLVIGPIDKKDQARFFEMLGNVTIAGRIHYIPWISSSDLLSYLEICDICLAPFHKNPQHESGVANKIYEYMLGSKPLVVSDCRPQQDLITKHKCGLVFSNMNEFKDAIITLLNEPRLRCEMGHNGLKAIQEEYNTKMIKDRFVLLYKNIEAENSKKMS
ncbi:MAG TPA: glycosyltransferase family 4 protein [Bacteroidales bacterium]|nr:glycosyltransferase family 4 protein [Bacteroidales bacterium]